MLKRLIIGTFLAFLLILYYLWKTTLPELPSSEPQPSISFTPPVNIKQAIDSGGLVIDK